MTEGNENKQGGTRGREHKRIAVKNQVAKEQTSEEGNFSIEENTVSSNSGGMLTMTLTSIAILLSIIAIFMSVVVLFTSDDWRQQAKEAVETTDKIHSVLIRVEAVENKLLEADKEGKAERAGRGLLELKKALLSFQEARSLIKDDELMDKIVKIENEMESLIILPEPTEIETTADVVLPKLNEIRWSEAEFNNETTNAEERNIGDKSAETTNEVTTEDTNVDATLADSDIETTVEENNETFSKITVR